MVHEPTSMHTPHMHTNKINKCKQIVKEQRLKKELLSNNKRLSSQVGGDGVETLQMGKAKY